MVTAFYEKAVGCERNELLGLCVLFAALREICRSNRTPGY